VQSQTEQPVMSSFGFLTNNRVEQPESPFNFISKQQEFAPVEKAEKMDLFTMLN